MLLWIVTGGAGSGKTRFCEVVGRLVPAGKIFSSDHVVAQKLANPAVAAQIRELFGRGVMAGEQIDRPKLRELVFTDHKARAALESLLHPMVYAEMAVQMEEARLAGVNLFLAEVPLFFESGGRVQPDLTVLVAVSAQTQIKRITDKRGLNEQEAERIIQAQLPLERKIALADIVIWNEGDLRLLEMQAQCLLQQIP